MLLPRCFQSTSNYSFNTKSGSEFPGDVDWKLMFFVTGCKHVSGVTLGFLTHRLTSVGSLLEPVSVGLKRNRSVLAHPLFWFFLTKHKQVTVIMTPPLCPASHVVCRRSEVSQRPQSENGSVRVRPSNKASCRKRCERFKCHWLSHQLIARRLLCGRTHACSAPCHDQWHFTPNSRLVFCFFY